MERPARIDLSTLITGHGIAPVGDPTLDALDRILRRAAHAAAARDAELVDLSAPLPAASAFPEGRLSPRMLVLLARALDPQRGAHVILAGEPLAALAALLMEAPPDHRPARIVLRSDDPARARLTLERLLERELHEAVTVKPIAEPTADDEPDRVLAWRTSEEAPAPPRPADGGNLLRVEAHGPRPAFIQETRLGDEVARMDIAGLDPSRPATRARPPSLPSGATLWRSERDTAPIRRLLIAERMQQRAWRGHATSRVEAGVAMAVKRLFEDAPAPPAGAPHHALARILLHLGYLEQVTATRRGAEALYLASLEACETAEGWTFLGWARAQQGRIAEATDACERAIDTDPTLGNPYNDLGAYRLSEGKRGEAKTWFERATRAERYMAPHYPYTNLARIHYEEGDLQAAREAAEEALARMPGYRPAERLLRMLGDREPRGPR